ncbi:hypothetical protein [Calidifontibacter terrae]
MPEQKTTEPAKRVAISLSGGGVGIWVGDVVEVRLDWEQTRQLHSLLADLLAEDNR